MNLTFGEKIKEMRQLHGLNQHQLAEKLNVTPRTIRGWELDGRIPTQSWVYDALAEIFNCPIEHFTESEPATTTYSPKSTPTPVTVNPTKFLSTAQALLDQHRLPKQEQLELMLELEHLLFPKD